MSMKKSSLITILLISGIIIGIILLIIINARTRTNTMDAPSENTENLLIQDARIDDIEIRIMESFPVQVQVTAFGNLPDGCTTVRSVDVDHNENIFDVRIQTQRERDAMCTLALVPFEETIALPVEDLPRGEYLVNVNGVSRTFPLQIDNFVSDEDSRK